MFFATSTILLALLNVALAAVIPRTLPAAVSLKPIVTSTGQFAGLLSAEGAWTAATGATYTVVPTGTAKNFYLQTSAGYCNVESSGFACASESSSAATQFQLVSMLAGTGSTLTVAGGNELFSADSNPEASSAVSVYTGYEHDVHITIGAYAV